MYIGGKLRKAHRRKAVIFQGRFFCLVVMRLFWLLCVFRAKLRNALLKRAIADIPIILRMQNEGPGIYNMYQQSMIGDREWHAFQE